MALARRYIPRDTETRSYYNPANGNLYSEVSKLHNAPTLAEAFAMVDTDNFYVCPMPKGTYSDPDSIYPKKADLEQVKGIKLVRYYSKTGSATIQVGEQVFDLYTIGTWFNFPEGTYLSDAVKAMAELKKLLTEHFQPADVAKGRRDPIAVELQSTPALTGVDLLRRKLPFGVKYENLPSDVEHIILTNFSQARQQLVSHFPGQETIAQLYNYDGLWYYAACCRHLPIGTILHDNKNEYLPYVAGFYRVRVQVPSEWNHIGLLPMKNPQGGRSLYPDAPEFEFESWCSDRELRLADQYAWKFIVLERILWPDTQAKGVPGQDPLRYWMEGLVKLRQEIAPKYPEPIKSMLRDAFRNLLNMGIGKMSTTSNKVDIYADDWSVPIPKDAHFKDEDLDTGTTHYVKNEDLTDFQKQTFMPHWVRYIWCHCKEKITREALKVPYNQLVSIRTDGLWTTAPSDRFEDTGKPGCMREKYLVNRGPFPWPQDDIEFIRMIQLARGGQE